MARVLIAENWPVNSIDYDVLNGQTRSATFVGNGGKITDAVISWEADNWTATAENVIEILDGSAVVATSNVNYLADINDESRNIFTFSGGNQLQTVQGKTYTIRLKIYVQVYDGALYITVGLRNSNLAYQLYGDSPTYTVTYNGNGNTGGSVPVDSTMYASGASVAVRANTGNLTRTNYTFLGWSTSSSATTPTYSVSGSSVSPSSFTMGGANVTLYAVWQQNVTTYTLTYNGNGNTAGTAPTGGNYNAGSTVTISGQGNLTRTNYNFKGWSLTSSGSVQYTQGQTFVINSNTVLYAVWAATYTVSYNGNGYTSGTVPSSSSRYEQGQTFYTAQQGTMARSGYTFQRWNTNSSGTGTNYNAGASVSMPNGGITLYAVWQQNVTTYTLTYNGNGNTGGTVPSGGTLNAGTIITAPGPGSLTLTNHNFKGWATSAGGPVAYTQGQNFTLNSNMTLYAVWQTTFTVTYNGNGATSGSVPVDASRYEPGATVAVLGNTGSLARTNYTFNGFSTSSAAASGVSTVVMPGGHLVLYAVWTEDQPQTYTVTYNGNGSTGGSVPIDGNSPYLNGAIVTVLGQGSLIKADHTFLGWATSPSGSVQYTQGQNFNINSDTTLYAVWQQNPKYAVTYHDTGADSGQPPLDQNSPYFENEIVTVQGAGSLQKTGHTLTGWQTTGGEGQPTETTLLDISSASTATNYITTKHPSAAMHVRSAFAEAFTGDGSYMKRALFNLRRYGTTSGAVNLSACIYSASGAAPNVLLHASTPIIFGNISSTAAEWIEFTFDGTFQVASGVDYYLVLQCDSVGLSDASGFIPPYLAVNLTVLTGSATFIFSNGVWGSTVNQSVMAQLFGLTNSGGGGVVYAPDDSFIMPSENVDLYPVWSETPKYTLTYDGNGNTGGSAPASVTDYVDTVLHAASQGSLVKTNYYFTKWNTQSNGSGTDYAVDAELTLNGNITLYAIWQENPKYTVTYHDTGADSGSPPTDPNSPYYSGSYVTVLDAGSLQKNGYTFTTWNTEPDGSGTNYAPTAAFVIYANTDLYPIWSPIVQNGLKVTYNGSGHTSGNPPIDQNSPYVPDPTTGTYTFTALNPGSMQKTGYVFKHWTFTRGSIAKLTDTLGSTGSSLSGVFQTIASGATGFSAVGQAFFGRPGQITDVKFRFRRAGTFTGTTVMSVRVYENAGTVLDTTTIGNFAGKSDSITFDDPTFHNVMADRTFHFSTPIVMTPGVVYVAVLVIESTGTVLSHTTSDPRIVVLIAPTNVSYSHSRRRVLQISDGKWVYSGINQVHFWVEDNSVVTVSPGETVTADADVVLSAVWEEVQTFTVTYAPGDHGTFTEHTTSGLYFGDPTPIPPAVTVEPGWQFTEWTPTPSSIVTGDATYTAQYTQILYTVKFLPGTHGTFTAVTYSNLVYGQNMPAPPTVTVEPGWEFTEWTPVPALTVTENVDYTAQYKQILYTVRYLPGDHGLFSTVGHADLTYGQATPAAPTVTTENGWVFVEWTPTPSAVVTETVDYVAQYTQLKFTVTYSPGLQGAFTPQIYTDLTYGQATPAFVGTPSGNAGYSFDHWEPNVASTVTASVEYVAVWLQLKFTVRYEPGAHGTFLAQEHANLTYGEAMPTFTGSITGDDGYRFTAWSPVPNTVVTASVVFTAQWELVTFKLTYHGNGYTSGYPPVDNTAYSIWNTQAIVQGQGSLVRVDHDFGGWSLTQYDTAGIYHPGSTFTMLDDTVLYAVWIPTSPGKPDPITRHDDSRWFRIAVREQQRQVGIPRTKNPYDP